MHHSRVSPLLLFSLVTPLPSPIALPFTVRTLLFFQSKTWAMSLIGRYTCAFTIELLIWRREAHGQRRETSLFCYWLVNANSVLWLAGACWTRPKWSSASMVFLYWGLIDSMIYQSHVLSPLRADNKPAVSFLPFILTPSCFEYRDMGTAQDSNKKDLAWRQITVKDVVLGT